MTDRLFLDDIADDEPSSDPGKRDRRFLRWLLLAVVLVVGGLYVAGLAFASDRLPEDTRIAGVEVGGLKPDRAEQVLRERLGERIDRPITLDVDGRTFDLEPAQLGLDVDVAASVDQVPVGRTWSVAEMWETFVGGEEYPAVVTTGSGVLEERLQEISEEVGEPPVEGAVRFEASGPEATFPEAGSGLDVAAASEAVVAAFPSDGEPVRLDLVDVEPELDVPAVTAAMREFADPAMDGPVTYRAAGQRVSLDPADYASALSMEVRDGVLEPAVDVDRLRSLLDPLLEDVLQGPQDATVRVVDGRPKVVPGRAGRAVDDERLGDSFLALVLSERRAARLPTVDTPPEVTVKDVRALGVKQKVSQFTTYYPHAEYRNINIGRAAELIDGTLLKPGETFSLNEIVGERTAENGFARGTIISNGLFKEDYGGGVSQVATTTFNAAFFAGLEDIEHKPHSVYIDRYPVGREATVAWPTVDLRFRNDTDYGVLIQTIHTPSSWSNSGSLTVRMFSTKVWDIQALTSERYAYTSPGTQTLTGDDCVPNTGYSGFQVDVTRVFRKAGESEIHHTEKMHTTYIASDTVICR